MAVDTETGLVQIQDYVVVEDGGVLVNPMIVDGQIRGATAELRDLPLSPHRILGAIEAAARHKFGA
jgi:CO/xanthine dehydrogenase Mo-binding subunit